jgi:hypothetical protein
VAAQIVGQNIAFWNFKKLEIVLKPSFYMAATGDRPQREFIVLEDDDDDDIQLAASASLGAAKKVGEDVVMVGSLLYVGC